MATKLFVGGLSWDTTEDKLREFFAQTGTVVSATIITDKFSGRSKGFGFVEMSTPEEAEQAKQKLNGQTLDGRSITVNDARPQQPKENRFSNTSPDKNPQQNTDKGVQENNEEKDEEE